MLKWVLRYYHNLNIAGKLRFLSLSTAIVSGIFIIGFLIAIQYVIERGTTEKEARMFAKILAENIYPSLLEDNRLAISNTLASVEYNEKISQTFVFDPSWNLLGAFHKGDGFSEQRKIIPIIRQNQNLWKHGFFYCVVPISFESKNFGHIVVMASLHNFYIRMGQYSVLILLVIFFSFLITYKFRAMLQQAILIPIARLHSIATNVIETKNLEHEMENFHHDELGELAKKFSQMLQDLHSYHVELNAQKKILSYQATHDALTTLPNRTLFNDRLEQSIYKAKRQEGDFALLFIDLDQFKEINDTFGHEYGDKLLIEVASRLKHMIREEDTLARFGGDEFTIIMNHIKDPYSISLLAQKILDSLPHAIDLGIDQVQITCSIGVSLCPQDSIDALELIKYADIAMYRSKASGRNLYHFYTDEMTEQVTRRVQMQNDIRRAIEKRSFVVFYQPQYRIPDRTIVGFEALLRWPKESGGFTPLNQFLPLAEETGMVLSINQLVMELAMQQAKEWHESGFKFGRIALNIVIVQLEDHLFVDHVLEMLEQYECQAQWFTMEIVESQIMKNPKVAITVLKALSDLGIEIAIDDFGTGYSSLSYLKILPIHKLKIDQSFIREISHKNDDTAIVEAIIALSKSLHMDLVAEGVETIEQEKFLLSHGCFHVQGYLYEYPLSVADITRKLHALRQQSL